MTSPAPPPRMMRMERGRLGEVVLAPLHSCYSMRAFHREDWDDCVALMLASPDPAFRSGPWDEKLCRDSLAFSADEHRDYPGGRGQIVFRDGEPVAMALSSATGYLNQVYTRRAHRRLGLAAAAVTAVLAALHDQGVGHCFLMVFEGNRGAIACYERLGFLPREASPQTDTVSI